MVYQRRSRLDRVFAGLADPTRRAILTRLASGDKTISELAARFDMSLPAVSKHVRVLERAGLARVHRDGRSRRTVLVAAPLREARNWIERYRRFWESQFDQLAAYLEGSTSAGASPTAGSQLDPDAEETASCLEDPREKRSRSDEPSKRPRSGSSRPGRPRKS